MRRDAEIAWAAGFFEGEGYFTARKWTLKDGTVRLYPIAGINNTDLSMLERFHEIVEVGKLRPRVLDAATLARFNAKPQWQWKTQKRHETESVFGLLEPWLSERRLARARSLLDNRGSLRAKTHCPYGHPYSPENTYQWKQYKWCRTCLEEKRRAKRESAADAAATA